MDPIPSMLVRWMHKEMETSKKKVEYSIPWLLLSTTSKIEIKRVLDQTLMLDQAQISLNSLKAAQQGKNYA